MANCAPCFISVLAAVEFFLMHILPLTNNAPAEDYRWNPRNCSFINSSHGLSVNCKNKGLSDVPPHLPKEATLLDLSKNNLTILHNSSFEDVPNLVSLIASENPISFIETKTMWPLTKLRSLLLISCHLQTMSPLLFIKNNLLTRLQLRRNHLNVIPSETLSVITRLSAMELSYNRIRGLNFDGYPIHHNLKRINLMLNSIEEVHPSDFLPLQNSSISFLSLASNKIKKLHRYAFHHLHSIKSLHLEGNQLNSFDIQPFLGMTSIGELSVYGCEIYQLLPLGNASYQNESIPSVSILQMRGNMIKNVPTGSFWGFTRLQTLVLRENKIRTFGNQSFCLLRSLRELDISNNDIESIPAQTFACLPRLMKLNVSHNFIRTLSPLSFNGIPRITFIGLSHNTIVDLNSDKTVWTLETLLKLDISNNDIRSISQSIFKGLTYLTELNLSFNPCYFYSAKAFKDLPNLERLLLFNQKKIYLQTTFQQLHTVLYLDISNAQVKASRYSIEQFVNMTHLHDLHIKRAQLTSGDLYDDISNQSLFTGLYSLKKLHLRENYLHSLDSRVFNNLPNLFYLDMKNCRILELRPTLFHSLPSLAILYLSGNKLVKISEDTFHGLFYLRVLYIQNNSLHGLETTTFAQNSRLTDLYLPGNQISIIKPGTVLPSNNSLRLDVSRNPFTCGCSLTWFRQWLDTADIDFRHPNQTVCSSTSLKELNNKPILSFQPKDHCGVNIVLIAVLSFSGLLVVMLAMLAYHKRWWLNHKLFLLKLAVVGYEEMEEEFNADNYHYHLNLMFQETEQEWVNQIMKPVLEERLPHLQNIIFGDEDLHLGMYYVNALYDAIDNSFKTVLLISNQSVKDAWTMTKLRMALEHVNDTAFDKVILIFIEEIEDENMPYLVRLFLSRNKPYMLWTDDADGQELFWAQFERSMSTNRAINNAIPL
ncbi:insulin-like growth factor-binding protein complex acid labile subunit [Lytechinus variegatus]|uniref:insulin-like growth factor-binding protein complex acid labile subunit n=1 Tax=Lytechinus variegatus TaxID=7654 RepID=UPI001BB0FAA7|nr:insulin-like growth factor-binding protein complex acid labile subunit [Lytechinus variegatus]